MESPRGCVFSAMKEAMSSEFSLMRPRSGGMGAESTSILKEGSRGPWKGPLRPLGGPLAPLLRKGFAPVQEEELKAPGPRLTPPSRLPGGGRPCGGMLGFMPCPMRVPPWTELLNGPPGP